MCYNGLNGKWQSVPSQVRKDCKMYVITTGHKGVVQISREDAFAIIKRIVENNEAGTTAKPISFRTSK